MEEKRERGEVVVKNANNYFLQLKVCKEKS